MFNHNLLASGYFFTNISSLFTILFKLDKCAFALPGTVIFTVTFISSRHDLAVSIIVVRMRQIVFSVSVQLQSCGAKFKVLHNDP